MLCKRNVVWGNGCLMLLWQARPQEILPQIEVFLPVVDGARTCENWRDRAERIGVGVDERWWFSDLTVSPC
jgi:hypothetical protein